MQVLVRNKRHDIIDGVVIEDRLEPGNYELQASMTGVYLQKMPDTIMPDKVYSNDADFIDHIVRSWNEGEGNVGVGLVGGKGLGKSFTGNMITQKLNLPVIRVSENFGKGATIEFLNRIEQDFVLFIDEFEKVFNTNKTQDNNGEMNQQDFLTYLDGGNIRSNRIMFLITANNPNAINEFLKNRPSRLRYFKNYMKLHDNIIREIVGDLLQNKEHKQDLIDNLPYEGLNIDVLIQIIKEMNTHGVPYSSFKDFFNFQVASYIRYEVYLVEGEKSELIGVVTNHAWAGDTIGRTKKGLRIYATETLTLRELDSYSADGYYFDPKDEDEETEIPVKLILKKEVNKMESLLM